jgi:outer membrane protein TolC
MSRHLLRAAALAAALASLGWAGAAPLSIEQAVELAVQRSQAAHSARASASSAAEMARAAGQLPDPMLTVGIDNLPVTGSRRFSTNAEDMTMKRVGLAQEWVSADKRSAREAVAQSVARREAVMVQVAAADARLQAALAYVDSYFLGQAQALTALNETYAREELQAGMGRLPTAGGSSAEVLQLSSALGAVEDDSGEVRQQHSAAQVGLQRWTGLPASELVEPHWAGRPTLDGYVAGHPLVLPRLQEVEVANGEVQLVRLNRQPNWTYEVSYGQRQGRPDLMSVGISIPLAVAPAQRQDRDTAAKLALVNRAQAELEEARRTAAAEYAALSSDATLLQQRVERFEAAVLKPLNQRTQATLAAYAANQASLVMVFEARRAEVDARRRWLNLQRDWGKAQAQLTYKPIDQGVAP